MKLSQKQEKKLDAKIEVDEKKEQYFKTGEKIYDILLNSYDKHQYNATILFCSYFEAYYQYFHAGYMWMKEKHKIMVEIKKKS